MPKIKFTATPKLPADYKHLGYKIGDEITAGQSWCDKWVNRGVAVHVPEDVAVAADDDLDLPAENATIGVDDAEGSAPEIDEEPKAAAELSTPGPDAAFRGRKQRK